jgi:integrase
MASRLSAIASYYGSSRHQISWHPHSHPYSGASGVQSSGAAGENIKYISSQLGHGSVQITVDRYGHLFPDERRAAAGRFEARLASSKNGQQNRT